MTINKIVLYLAIFVIIFIIWLWLTWDQSAKLPTFEKVSKKYDEYMKTPSQLYERTVGHIKDSMADLIISKGVKKENMYRNNELNSGISTKNQQEAINNAFTLGNVYRYNIAPNDQDSNQYKNRMLDAGVYYGRTLNRITQNPIPGAEFMIDTIQDYYDNFLAEYLLNPDANQHTPQILQDFERALGGNIQNRDGFIQVREIVAQTNRSKPKIQNKRTVIEKKFNETDKQHMQNIYFEERDIRNDPQNVHEPEVVHELNTRYRKIRSKNAMEEDLEDKQQLGIRTSDPISEIRNEISKSKNLGEVDKRRALTTLNTMSGKNYVSSLDTNESEILKNVWDRVNSHENENNKEELKQSFIRSLSECVEPDWQGNDQQVCTVGRVSRIINTLTLQDNDNEISKPVRTTELLRNEIFAKSHNIIQKELLKADPLIARAYNGVQIEPDSKPSNFDEKIHEFEEHLKNQISTTIQSDYKDVKPETLTNLIFEAQQGV